MEKIIDTLLEDIKNNWDIEDLGQFLCNIYALGRLDEEVNREPENTEILFLMSPFLDSTTIMDYINIRLGEYIDEMEEPFREDIDFYFEELLGQGFEDSEEEEYYY